MPAAFPGCIWNPSPDEDNVTPVDADYMEMRDDEIVAIENALGQVS